MIASRLIDKEYQSKLRNRVSTVNNATSVQLEWVQDFYISTKEEQIRKRNNEIVKLRKDLKNEIEELALEKGKIESKYGDYYSRYSKKRDTS